MFQSFLTVIIILGKVLVPCLIWWFPFVGMWGNYVLDIVDGDILQFLGMSDATYQLIDKSADLWSYVVMLVVGWRWHLRKTIVVLFAYRLIGQILFFVTGNELMFVYFQNFLEPLLLIYTAIWLKVGSETQAFRVYKKYWWQIWLLVVAYKVWNEWYLHFANIDLSQYLFGINGNKG